MAGGDEPVEIFGLPKSGDVLAGKYRIDRLIGQGGMGAVYVAEHEILRQPVAIKLLLPEIAENEEAVSRFLNEARAAARIRSEHVAAVMDVGKLENGSAYMVLEYLDGADLSGVLEERGPLPIEEAVDYILQALEAVAQAHALGIVHRDLKPANLFLARRQDGSPIIKVLDFGISKATNQAANAAVTATTALLGSPGYMSPEQVRSSKRVDARTDLWSMGVILYRLLTNKAPFDGDNLGAVFAAILEETPPGLRTVRPEIPEALELTIARCLERDREKRWPNCAELAMALALHASPEGALAADRICRTLAVTPSKLTRITPTPELTSGIRHVPLVARASEPPASAETAAAQAASMASENRTGDATRKKPNRLPLIIAGGALIAGIAVLSVKLLGGSSSAATPAATASTAATAVPAPKPSADVKPATSAAVEPAAASTPPAATSVPAPPASVPALSASVPAPPASTPPTPAHIAPVKPPPPATTTKPAPTSPDEVLFNRK